MYRRDLASYGRSLETEKGSDRLERLTLTPRLVRYVRMQGVGVGVWSTDLPQTTLLSLNGGQG